jgi:FtsZ-binding cell division protein ZapB
MGSISHAMKVLQAQVEDLENQVKQLEWSQEDAQNFADSVRRRHDRLHSQPWQWCDVDLCALVREHDLG